MGVRGLSTFMSSNPHLFTKCQLHDCSLVIDANNLCHYLYHLFDADTYLGGDYSYFYTKIVQWLESFKKCRITLYLVFDGAYDPSDGKLQTTMSRAKDRLTAAKQLTKRIFGRKVLPILALDTLRDALIALGIPHAHSDYEADVQVVALANHLGCPVMSLDSDFYIYDLSNGFVPLSMLDMSVQRSSKKGSEDESQDAYHYLSCRLYSVDRFLGSFDDLDRSKLPLLAAIVGNDNVNYSTTLTFFNAVSLPKRIDSRLMLTATQKPILGLLSWLQRSTPEEAVEKMVTCLKGDLKSKTRKALLNSLSAYNVCSSSFIRHLRLERSLTGSGGQKTKEPPLKTKFGCVVPDWCRRKLQSGAYPPFFLNVLVNRRIFLLTQVEMFGQASSYDCSLALRQVLYGILLSDDAVAVTKRSPDKPEITEGETDEATSRPSPSPSLIVSEYGRHQGSFNCVYTKATEQLPVFGRLPGLTALHTMSRSDTLALLLETLQVDANFVRTTSPTPDWSLFLCALVFWLRSSGTLAGADIRRFLDSLILTALNTSLTIAYKKSPRRKKSRKVETTTSDDDSCQMPDVDSLQETVPGDAFRKVLFDSDRCRTGLAELSSKFQREPTIDNGHPPNLRGLHWYAELQTCLMFASYLNRLLGGPLPGFRTAILLNGIFLYNVYADLGARSLPEDYLAILLGRGSPLHVLFVRLRDAVVEAVAGDLLDDDGEDVDYSAARAAGRAAGRGQNKANKKRRAKRRR